MFPQYKKLMIMILRSLTMDAMAYFDITFMRTTQWPLHTDHYVLLAFRPKLLNLHLSNVRAPYQEVVDVRDQAAMFLWRKVGIPCEEQKAQTREERK